MPTGARIDPYLSFNYDIEITGMVVGSFSEVSGLEAETEFEEYREGGRNSFIHKLPRITRYPNLVLRKGMTSSDVLYKWHQDVVLGNIKPKQIGVILLDSIRKEVKRWTFDNAFPIKWIGPSLKAENSAIAVEAVEMAHQGLVRVVE